VTRWMPNPWIRGTWRFTVQYRRRSDTAEDGRIRCDKRSPLEWQSCESFRSRNNALRSLRLPIGVARCKAGQQFVDEWVECRGMGMTRLIDRQRRLVLETPLLIGKRPLVVVLEPWGLALRQKGCHQGFSITWAQVWNRAGVIAAEQRLAQKRSSGANSIFAKGERKGAA
jgi:hypothetical protein